MESGIIEDPPSQLNGKFHILPLFTFVIENYMSGWCVVVDGENLDYQSFLHPLFIHKSQDQCLIHTLG